MCNLYSLTRNQDAMRALFRVRRDHLGNLPPLPGIFPDYPAPIVRTGADGEREIVMARWGMQGLPGKGILTNIRNPQSGHWRRGMKPSNRCLVPFTSFCEYEDTKPRKTATWFALNDSRPLCAFAGIWTTWRGTRGTKADPVEGEHEVFAFLTTEPNREVGAIHPKAMPVVLTNAEDCETWLLAPLPEALGLQRPLADGALRIVARGEKQDPPAEAEQPRLLL